MYVQEVFTSRVARITGELCAPPLANPLSLHLLRPSAPPTRRCAGRAGVSQGVLIVKGIRKTDGRREILAVGEQ